MKRIVADFVKTVQHSGAMDDYYELSDPMFYKDMERDYDGLSFPELVAAMDKEISETYNKAGIEGVKRLRDENKDRLDTIRTKLEGNTRHKTHYELCRDFAETMITRIEHFLENIPAIKPTVSEMKSEAIECYKKNKRKFETIKSGRAVAFAIIEHLKIVYPEAKKYPDESVIRRDWLKLTS
ncbi:MAG: hypothetical protein WD097_07755 [Balneolales bacterium]